MRTDGCSSTTAAPAPVRKIRPPCRARRTTGERLRTALSELAGPHARLLGSSKRAWASITFCGARHSVSLAFEGAEAVEAGEAFIAALPEHEFAIPGQLVADATVAKAEHRLLPEPLLKVTAELLLIEEG